MDSGVRQPVHDVGIILFSDNHLLPAQRTPDLTPGAYRFNGIGQARIAEGPWISANCSYPEWSPRRGLAGGSRQQWPAVSNGFCFDSPHYCFFAFEKRDPRIALSTSDIKRVIKSGRKGVLRAEWAGVGRSYGGCPRGRLSWGISSSVAATPTAGNSGAGNSSEGLPQQLDRAEDRGDHHDHRAGHADR